MPGRNSDETPDPGVSRPIALGGATFAPDRLLVTRGAEAIRLRPRTADVLAHLVAHAGRVVPKQALFDAVWGDVAVTDDSLVQCLVEIRRALGPDHALVRTVRGRGYLLELPVHGSAPAPGRPAPVAPPDPAAARLPVAAMTREPLPARAVRLRLGTFAALAMLASLSVTAAVSGPGLRATAAGGVAPSETLHDDARQDVEAGLALLARSRAQVDVERARRLFARAVDADPAYAPGHAGLGNVLVMLSGFGAERPADVLPAASAAARRAVALDATLASAWQALAHVQTQWDWDWDGAERSYRRAIALDPQAPFNMIFAHLLAGLGRADEAVVESERWLAVAPDAGLRWTSNCVVKYLVRRYADAVAACDRALAASPEQAGSHFWRALALSALGDHTAAMHAALAARTPAMFTPTWVVGYVHARAGRLADAREVLRAAEARARRDYVPPVDLALLHTAIGDRARALDALERGLRERGRWMELLAVLPPLDDLRGEPRFQALLTALRLPRLP
jgi:DNA-binding winged helix-turn-helix (wHTH) protein/tetratricopeptide (TPR) repeat protein